MELHIQSILIFLFVAIVGSHAALVGAKQGNGERTVYGGYRITHRKLVANHTKSESRTEEVKSGSEKKQVYATVKPNKNPFGYGYSNKTSPFGYGYSSNKNSTGRSLFFLQKDMKPGHQMTINFPKTTNEATFLPRDKARSLPFSTDKMPEILHEFSLQPGSQEAQIIEETIRECERKGIPGEQKYCATCLEDMIDYAKSTLGKNVKAISTGTKDGYKTGQRYTIGHVMKAAKDDNVMVCHKQEYAYAVFYCHTNKGTSPHIMSLISDEGKKARVVAVCHKDTSDWNPKHMAFQFLNVKPGSLPICHFLPEDHIVWVRN
ncbi:hypothetical protein RND81_03G151700 [Saponaria officinalis]|uniref:BURP domain-containing protein n=1 Tax=Saponaria officinalis TaxID=3572 RepID=A0AAW1M889_SAPOF